MRIFARYSRSVVTGPLPLPSTGRRRPVWESEKDVGGMSKLTAVVWSTDTKPKRRRRRSNANLNKKKIRIRQGTPARPHSFAADDDNSMNNARLLKMGKVKRDPNTNKKPDQFAIAYNVKHVYKPKDPFEISNQNRKKSSVLKAFFERANLKVG